jgi:hypothetical protein
MVKAPAFQRWISPISMPVKCSKPVATTKPMLSSTPLSSGGISVPWAWPWKIAGSPHLFQRDDRSEAHRLPMRVRPGRPFIAISMIIFFRMASEKVPKSVATIINAPGPPITFSL